jgi:glycosyltransferase involved in cell wall biosynthesis
MINICLVSYHYWPPKFGGELLMSIERFEELVRRGHRVTVLTAGAQGFPRYEVKAGIEIFRSPIIHTSRLGRGLRRLLFPVWVNWMLRKLQSDVVHLSGTGGFGPITSNLGAMWVNSTAHSHGARTIWVHSLADTKEEAFSTQGLKNRLRQIFLKRIDTIVSVSPALNHGVAQAFPEKAVQIVYGVRDDLFRPLPDSERIRLRAEQGIGEQEVVFVFLGSVSRRKGFDVLARAFAELSSKFPNWYLWVIGPRTMKENQNIDLAEVAQICAPLEDVRDRVRYWGRIDDRNQLKILLALSDIFAFPTLREGMPISPVEAMAVGLPVIISRLPGVTDVAFLEGQTGLFVTPGDLDSLKAAMHTLGEQTEIRWRMGRAALERIHEGFEWQPFMDRWEALYQGEI